MGVVVCTGLMGDADTKACAGIVGCGGVKTWFTRFSSTTGDGSVSEQGKPRTAKNH